MAWFLSLLFFFPPRKKLQKWPKWYGKQTIVRKLSKERVGFLGFEIAARRESCACAREREKETGREREREREIDRNREDSFVALSPPLRLASWSKQSERRNRVSPVKSGRSRSICWLSYSRNCITRSRPRAGECAPFYCPHFPPFSCFSTWWVAGRKDTVSGANRSTIPTTLWRYEWPTHVGGITSASSPSSSIP